MTTADTGVTNDDFGGLDGAAAFLTNLLPPEEKKPDAHQEPSEPVEKKEDVTPEKGDEDEHSSEEHTDDEENSDESPEGSEEEDGSEEGKQPEKKYADDEVYVKIKVGDQELEVPVKDLKRLHGQEASLTRKSQEVAEQRKTIDNQRLTYAAKLDALVKRATEKANQYRQVNFMALTKDPNVTAEMLNALQTEARSAFEEETFLKGELKEFVDGVQKQRQTELVTQAREAVKTLQDETSPHFIEGFNQKTYDTMRQFAIDNGVPAQLANNIVEAPVLKILHMAMMYKKGASKILTTKTNKSPKKIVKATSRAVQHKQAPAIKQERTMKKLKENGSTENAADAFLSRWEASLTE